MGDSGMAEPVSGAEDRPASEPDAAAKPPPRKRRRIVISCTECHRRKQKCDRKLPCTNCQSRNKESSCRYETGKPVAKADDSTTEVKAGTTATAATATSSSSSDERQNSDSLECAANTNAKLNGPTADFGYSTSTGSTLGFLRKIENAGGGAPLAGMPVEIPTEESYDMRERYKSLIRQLPARTYVEQLMDVYLNGVNWQYCGIDEPLTRKLMHDWYSLSFNVLSNSGPLALDPMLRALPALMFQMIACALLYLPPETEKDYECLKYTSDMTFDDLSAEYSEAGMAILNLLGKRQMSIITVLAGWCRASHLKFSGMVTEAWHQVGTCIRDAQGIGLHRDQSDQQPTVNDTPEEAMEKMWMAQHRRMIWVILLGWDLHTGAVLGRPTSVDHRTINRSLPVDSLIPKGATRIPLMPRSDDDPPTPQTRSIWSWEIMKTLRDILDLEKEGPFPKDFSKVEKIHAEILDIRTRTPPPFRNENPDTRFDDLPECWWLPYVRAQLPQLSAFNILALHRPYVFTRSASRNAALKASLEMLESQRQQYAALNATQHRTYSLFFGTFDAVVMVASIYILFPREHLELLDQARQHFQWAVDRFEKMAERNHLARSALGVLQAIWIRFKKAVGHGFLACRCANSAQAETEAATRWLNAQSEAHAASTAASTASPSATSTTQSHILNHRASHDASASATGTGTGTCSTQASSGTELSTPLGTGPSPSSVTPDSFVGPEWTLPTDFDFSTIMPMYPMGDIAYNDLTGVHGAEIGGGGGGGVINGAESTLQAAWREGDMATTGAGAGHATMATDLGGTGAADLGMPGLHTMSMGQEQFPWQFGGEFGTDTIWNVLNQFPS
ncbi:hypothetical protein F4808DRAFT_67950 [Astrocystis sublimbata]|nr:hypothetical protein F4808DRAFT_67950 [Astrocystis sublimbata]